MENNFYEGTTILGASTAADEGYVHPYHREAEGAQAAWGMTYAESDNESDESDEPEQEEVERAGTPAVAPLANERTIFVAAVGQLGDVLPFVALGRALQDRGYVVTIGAHREFAAMIDVHGLGYVELGMGLEEQFHTITATARLVHCVVLTCRSLLVGFSALEAARMTVPVVCNTYPVTPTADYAPAESGASRSLLSVINNVKWSIRDSAVWREVRDRINKLRADLDLPPVESFRDAVDALRDAPTTTITAYSQYLYRRPTDWAMHEHLTGPITYDGLALIDGFEPPADLRDFLARELRPVYIGVGSMLATMDADAQDALIALWVQALYEAGMRGVISTHGAVNAAKYANRATEEGERESHVFFVPYFVPHTWLFRQCSAAVHHGGAGTTQTALKCSLPAFITPFAAGDQPFHADRLHELALVPEPVEIHALTVQVLVDALQALQDPALRARVEEQARRMRAESGTARAADIVERACTRGVGRWLAEMRERYSAQCWMPDAETTRCCRCRRRFRFTLRRHHCRSCGLIFCYLCTSRQLPARTKSGQPKMARACIDCFETYGAEELHDGPVSVDRPEFVSFSRPETDRPETDRPETDRPETDRLEPDPVIKVDEDAEDDHDAEALAPSFPALSFDPGFESVGKQ